MRNNKKRVITGLKTRYHSFPCMSNFICYRPFFLTAAKQIVSDDNENHRYNDHRESGGQDTFYNHTDTHPEQYKTNQPVHVRPPQHFSL